MEKKLIILITLMLTSVVSAQVTLEWARTYNGSMNNNDIANAVTVDDSGNVYVTGIINGNPPTIDICTIKYKPNGDSVWTRVYGLPGNSLESGIDLLVDSLGNVFVTGFPYTIKYSPNGTLLWLSNNNSGCLKILKDNLNNIVTLGALQNYYYVLSKYNASNGDSLFRTYIRAGNNPSDMAIDKQGNIYIAGITNGPFPPTYQDFLVVKCNSNGDSVWSWRYNGIDPQQPYDFAYSIDVDDSGYIYATGGTDDLNGTSKYFTVKLTPGGDSVWTRKFNIGGSYSYKINVTKFGDVYVTGITNAFNYTVIKYLTDGTFQWSRTLSGFTFPPIPHQTIDTLGNVYVTTISNSANGIQIAKYNQTGNQQWYVTYAGGEPKDILANTNNVYVVGNYGGVDYLTLKYSQPLGIQIISNEIPKSFKLYQNYPNPFNPNTIIRFDIPSNVKSETSNLKLIIFDVLGREVATLVNKQLKPGTYEASWNASNFASGVYFYKLVSRSFSQTKKLILVK